MNEKPQRMSYLESLPKEKFQIKCVKSGTSLNTYDLVDQSKADFETKMTPSQYRKTRDLLRRFCWFLSIGDIADVEITSLYSSVSVSIEKQNRTTVEMMFSDGIAHHIIGKAGKVTTTDYRKDLKK
jgi:hypothetical protein